jgi:selenocysteine lyase/cysteine desulfurase
LTISTSRRQLLKGAGAAAVLAQVGVIRRAAGLEGPSVAAGELEGMPPTASDYGLDPSVTYLNHASIGTMPNAVSAAHHGYLELCETNPWLYMWSEPWIEPLEAVRTRAANLLGCAADDVSILHNTTECFNLLAQGLPLADGDEVVFSSLNHAGASVCWFHLAGRKGYTVRQFDLPIADVAAMTEDQVVERHVDAIGPRTRLLVLPHVDNTVGLRHPVARIAAAARERGVRWIAVDGAQTVNMIPVDVRSLGVDVYATSAHKWSQAPKGTGFAYFGREIRDELQPMWVTWGQKYWAGSARVFEDYGTRALPAVLALGDALGFQERLAMERREAHHRQLWSDLREIVGASESLIWRSPSAWSLSAGLYSVEVRERSSSEIAGKLFSAAGIVVRPFARAELNALRVSPNVANERADLERFADAIPG